jgi:hypothetical protein
MVIIIIIIYNMILYNIMSYMITSHIPAERGCALPTATVPPTGADVHVAERNDYICSTEKRFIPLTPQPHISYTISPGFPGSGEFAGVAGSWIISLEQYGTIVACSGGGCIPATQG